LFAALCEDESLWHKKLLADFNFTGAETARTSGWKFIYKGLDMPQGNADSLLHLLKFTQISFSLRLGVSSPMIWHGGFVDPYPDTTMVGDLVYV